METQRNDNRFDLHTHSLCSDGADTPTQVVEKAVAAQLQLLALTDHDCTVGVEEALTAGKRLGVTVLPAVEMDNEWATELHILGLDVDVNHPRLTSALELAQERRIQRNEIIFEKLKQAGYDILPFVKRSAGSTTRLHIALGLVDGGFAKNVPDAFANYLRKGCVGYYTAKRFPPEEVIDILKAAGGVPVWAHPFHGGSNVHKMVDMLVSTGLEGVEAYHSACTEGESEVLVSLAHQRGLLVTCGSDSHGANRPSVHVGCTWRNTPELKESFDYFINRTQGNRQ